jgi:enoyl-CoA hydratase
MAAFETILAERRGPVGIVTLNRPAVRNALSRQLIEELAAALDTLEAETEIRCLIVTGGDKVFAAGGDIKQMSQFGFADVYLADGVPGRWERIAACRIPTVAAVAGYALGGGCELALQCDIIVAAETAVFGQPEITIGTIPGGGGTQRLPRRIGRAKAMDLCLTGRFMNAAEAERLGLVSRVVPAERLMEEAMAVAEKIAALSRPIAMMAKEAVNAAEEVPLADGIRLERRLFHATFATADQKEGMTAFMEKRKPSFKHR